MVGIKTTHFKWLTPPGKEKKKHKHANKTLKECKTVRLLMVWIFNRIVVPLLRGCFYVTESSCHKNKVFYYRKPIWRIIRGLGMRPLLGSLYEKMNVKRVNEKLESNECLGVHNIRLLPGQKKV